MRLLAFLAADYANIEQGGKLNVMGIFNDINAQSFPARHLTMHLVVKLGAELGEVAQTRLVTIRLIDEDANEMVSISREVEMSQPAGGRYPEVNLIAVLNDLIFHHPGRYEFVVLVDNDFKGEIPIYVNEIPAPEE